MGAAVVDSFAVGPSIGEVTVNKQPVVAVLEIVGIGGSNSFLGSEEAHTTNPRTLLASGVTAVGAYPDIVGSGIGEAKEGVGVVLCYAFDCGFGDTVDRGGVLLGIVDVPCCLFAAGSPAELHLVFLHAVLDNSKGGGLGAGSLGGEVDSVGPLQANAVLIAAVGANLDGVVGSSGETGQSVGDGGAGDSGISDIEQVSLVTVEANLPGILVRGAGCPGQVDAVVGCIADGVKSCGNRAGNGGAEGLDVALVLLVAGA